MIGGRSAAFARDALIIRCSSHLLTKYAFEYSSTSSGRSRSTALVKSRRMGWSSSGTLMSIAARSPEAPCLWNDATFPLQELSAATQPLFRKLLLLYQ